MSFVFFCEKKLKENCAIGSFPYKNLFFLLFFRRWKGGLIEPHPTEKALIVNYKLEATIWGLPGDSTLEQKRVSFFSFS